MFRITTHLAKSYLISVRKKVTDGSSALVVVPARKYATPYDAEKCPESKPKKKTHKFMYSVFGILLLTGTAIVYAKNTAEVRKWLEKYASPLDRVVSIAYQEDETYFEFASNILFEISDVVRDILFGKEGITLLEFMTRLEQDLKKKAELDFAPKNYELPQKTLEPLHVQEKESGPVEVGIEATDVETEKCESAKPCPGTTHIT